MIEITLMPAARCFPKPPETTTKPLQPKAGCRGFFKPHDRRRHDQLVVSERVWIKARHPVIIYVLPALTLEAMSGTDTGDPL